MECPVAKLWKKVHFYVNVYTGMIVIFVTDSIQVGWMMQLCLRIVLSTDAEEILPAMLRDQSDQSKATNLSVAGYILWLHIRTNLLMNLSDCYWKRCSLSEPIARLMFIMLCTIQHR